MRRSSIALSAGGVKTVQAEKANARPKSAHRWPWIPCFLRSARILRAPGGHPARPYGARATSLPAPACASWHPRTSTTRSRWGRDDRRPTSMRCCWCGRAWRRRHFCSSSRASSGAPGGASAPAGGRAASISTSSTTAADSWAGHSAGASTGASYCRIRRCTSGHSCSCRCSRSLRIGATLRCRLLVALFLFGSLAPAVATSANLLILQHRHATNCEMSTRPGSHLPRALVLVRTHHLRGIIAWRA